jgi:cell division protein FtsI (penicillin-binding protein 3)
MDAKASSTSVAGSDRARRWDLRFVQSMLYGDQVDRERKAKARLGLAIVGFSLIYAIIAARLVIFVVAPNHALPRNLVPDVEATARPDILDRNGEILATDIKAPSLFAVPALVQSVDVDEAVELLTAVMPALKAEGLRGRLMSKSPFVWLWREISPEQQEQVKRLGVAGVGFKPENKRVYPNGVEVSHILGYVDIKNEGEAGVERWIDDHQGLAELHKLGFASDRQQVPVQLAVDLRVQHVLHDELAAARDKFKAHAAAGVVLDVRTGEVIGMVSIPDYDPANPGDALDPNPGEMNRPSPINRVTKATYEMGSVFKAFTVAMALDSGKVKLTSSFDASKPMQYGRFTIHDFHAQNRVLTVPEIFTYSSNIGAARMALAVGVEGHQAFLKKLGQLNRVHIELPETADPQVPKPWGELNTVTISYGHGLSVTPLQAAMGVAALVNGGVLIPPTFLKRSESEARALATRVIKPETSAELRFLMRLNAEKGTAREADVPGYYVGGKTGTAEKVHAGHYIKNRLFTDFVATLPADNPRYVILLMLDEPQPLAETKESAVAAVNVGPTTAKVIARIAPLLGLEPRFELPTADRLILASAQQTR